LKFQISPSKISEIIEITMMITRFGQMVNYKRPPKPSSFINTLFKIVRGRGLVRRSRANDHFLLLICSFYALVAVIFKYLQLCRFLMTPNIAKSGTRDVAPDSKLLL
jgi:MFS-type transporter involved in bile tolerance (Atg22 family)